MRYETPGAWQTLKLADLPQLVRRQARLLRANAAAGQIDERGAYIDSVAIIVPSAPAGAEFWTAELAIEGVLTEGADPTVDRSIGDHGAAADALPKTVVSVSARGFAEDGAPIFPRVWSLRGEPLDSIEGLGFNAIAVENGSDAAFVDSVKETALRVVTPVPILDRSDAEQARSAAFDSRPVLFWTLPQASDRPSLDAARPLVSRFREDPRFADRPLVAAPQSDYAAWSRLADALVLEAGPADALMRQGRFARSRSAALPGSAAVARVTLTRGPQAADQLRAFAPAGKAAAWRPPGEVEASVWSAIASGANGVWMTSDQPLNGRGDAQKLVAATVELINLRLALIEPWLVAGGPEGVVYGGDREPAAVVFRSGRTKMVLGVRRPRPASAGAAGPGPGVIIPAVPETALAYAMTPAGLDPLDRRRTVGGVEVDAAALAPGGVVLLTDDRRAVRDINRRIASTAAKAVTLQQRLAIAELAEWELIVKPPSLLAPPESSVPVSPSAMRMISRSKALQSGGQLSQAYRAAAGARRMLAEARRGARRTLSPPGRLDSSPLTLRPSTWPDEVRLRQLLRPSPRSGNLLAGGDFERLDRLRELGWRYTRLDGAAGASVELSEDAPAHGDRCLTIRSTHAAQGDAVAWVTSPRISAPAGKLIEITGWVRFRSDEPGEGSLAVVDTLGGDELAIRVSSGDRWRPFRMLRRPTSLTDLRVAFVFSGVGRASIDAVMVRPIAVESQPADAAPAPAAVTAGAGPQRK